MSTRELPDYIPVTISRILEAKGLSLRALTQRSGFSGNRLYAYFSSPSNRLKPYLQMAKAGGLTLDQLLKIIEDGHFPAWIGSVCLVHQVPTVTALCRKLGISPGLWLRLQRSGEAGSTLKDAHAIAKALEISLDDLAEAQYLRVS